VVLGHFYMHLTKGQGCVVRCEFGFSGAGGVRARMGGGGLGKGRDHWRFGGNRRLEINYLPL
jgi:hypothetical protein